MTCQINSSKKKRCRMQLDLLLWYMKESPRAKRAVLLLGYQLKLKGNKYGLRLSLMRWRIYPGKVNLQIDNTYLQCKVQHQFLLRCQTSSWKLKKMRELFTLADTIVLTYALLHQCLLDILKQKEMVLWLIRKQHSILAMENITLVLDLK